MLAAELINYEIPQLKLGDEVGNALGLMQEFKVNVLAVVDDTNYLGTLDEDFLLNFDEHTLLRGLPLKNPDFGITNDLSIIQIVDYLLEKEIEIVPVFDKAEILIGMIYVNDANAALANSIYSGKGSVIELKLGQKDYSLAEISRIVENEGVSIQKLFVSKDSGSEEDGFSIYLKFNKKDVGSAISSLKRFGYKINSFTPESAVNDLEKDRYEMLMKYLNV
jgi:acetoin utilization protein AcuB